MLIELEARLPKIPIKSYHTPLAHLANSRNMQSCHICLSRKYATTHHLYITRRAVALVWHYRGYFGPGRCGVFGVMYTVSACLGLSFKCILLHFYRMLCSHSHPLNQISEFPTSTATGLSSTGGITSAWENSELIWTEMVEYISFWTRVFQ